MDIRRRTYLLSLLSMGEVLCCGKFTQSTNQVYNCYADMSRTVDLTKEFVLVSANVYGRASSHNNVFITAIIGDSLSEGILPAASGHSISLKDDLKTLDVYSYSNYVGGAIVLAIAFPRMD